MTTNQKGIKRLSVILVVAMLLSLIPATLGFAAEVDTAKVEAFVSRLYVAALDRQPDAGGLKYWTNQLASHNQTAAQGISFILVESKEFQAKGLTDSAFLDTVYKAFFNRAADASGKAFWLTKLEQGFSRRWVIQQMVGAMTGEFQAICKDAGIVPGKVGGVTSKDLAFLVESVVATNTKTIVATFNKEVGAAVATNFSVYEKGNEYALNYITGITVSGKTVTVSVLNAFADGKEYVLESKDVPAKDTSKSTIKAASFKYVKQTASSISFKATTIAKDSKVEYVIKDAAGNDITKNFADSDVEFQTSNTSVLALDRTAAATGYVVANAKIKDTTIETGNTIITVVATLQNLTSVGRWSLSTDLEKPQTSLFMESTALFKVEALDQNGKEATGAIFKFRSLSPTVAVVEENAGTVYPVSVGTATVMVTAIIGDRQVSKYVTIQVKAKPVATSIKLDTTSVVIVKGSNIARSVKVEVLDQYGDAIDVATGLQYKISKLGVATVPATADTYVDQALVKGKAEISFIPVTTGDPTSATVTVKYGNLTRTLTVSLVNASNFVGYIAVASDTTLDLYPDQKVSKGPKTVDIGVYERDANGNYIKEVTSGLDFVADNSKVTVDGTTGLVTAVETGTSKVTVKVGTATIAVLTFNVVDSAPALTSLSQNYNAISVDKSETLVTKLFGTSADGGVFVGYNQYGDKVQIQAGDWQVLSSNSTLIDNNLVINQANAPGTSTLTFIIADKFFTLVVNVR